MSEMSLDDKTQNELQYLQLLLGSSQRVPQPLRYQLAPEPAQRG